MNIKYIKSCIKDKLGSFMISEGFEFKETKSSFIKSTEDYKYIVYIELLGKNGFYSLDLYFHISNNFIEKKIEEILGKQRHNITLGNNLGYIKYSPDGKKRIKGSGSLRFIPYDDNIDLIISDLKSSYIEVGKKYFLKYSSLQSIDELFNTEPFDFSPVDLGGLWRDRFIKGLIIANKTNNPNYYNLVKLYDKLILETESEEDINDYNKVKNFLAT